MKPSILIDELVRGTASIEFTRALGDGRAMTRITAASGAQFEVRVHLQRPRGHRQATIALYRTQKSWSTEELERRGLPLYWSRPWLLGELERRKSVREVAIVTGVPAPLLRRWKQRHGINGNPRYDMIRREYATGRFSSRKQAATEFGISEATLHKILNPR